MQIPVGALSGGTAAEIFSMGPSLVNGPLNETAVFYAGVTISSPANGGLTYDYGAVHGTVNGGSTTILSVPPGTAIVFKEVPSSFLYTIGAWNLGNTTGSAASSSSVVVSGPTNISVALGFNYTIPGIIVGVGIAAAAALFLLKRRGAPSIKIPKIVDNIDE